jgi:steroid delta-isomerase-like uncharacterized protein
MFIYCKENLKDINYLVSENGNLVASEFFVTGTYVISIPGFPEANNQHYELSCGSFFEIEDNKIFRVTVYYNLNEWLRQIK